MKYTEQELNTIARNMKAYGGSFIKCIGKALQYADAENTIKLVQTFSEECEKFLYGWK